MITRIATCACRKLRVTARGEPVRISICHCLECQRRTGSAFGIQARFPDEDVTIEGESRTFSRTGDEGTTATFHFCPECGSTVYYRLQAMKGVTAVPIGAFADPTFPPPRISVYEARRHPWVSVPEDAEHYD